MLHALEALGLSLCWKDIPRDLLGTADPKSVAQSPVGPEQGGWTRSPHWGPLQPDPSHEGHQKCYKNPNQESSSLEEPGSVPGEQEQAERRDLRDVPRLQPLPRSLVPRSTAQAWENHGGALTAQQLPDLWLC